MQNGDDRNSRNNHHFIDDFEHKNEQLQQPLQQQQQLHHHQIEEVVQYITQEQQITIESTITHCNQVNNNYNNNNNNSNNNNEYFLSPRKDSNTVVKIPQDNNQHTNAPMKKKTQMNGNISKPIMVIESNSNSTTTSKNNKYNFDDENNKNNDNSYINSRFRVTNNDIEHNYIANSSDTSSAAASAAATVKLVSTNSEHQEIIQNCILYWQKIADNRRTQLGLLLDRFENLDQRIRSEILRAPTERKAGVRYPIPDSLRIPLARMVEIKPEIKRTSKQLLRCKMSLRFWTDVSQGTAEVRYPTGSMSDAIRTRVFGYLPRGYANQLQTELEGLPLKHIHENLAVFRSL